MNVNLGKKWNKMDLSTIAYNVNVGLYNKNSDNFLSNVDKANLQAEMHMTQQDSVNTQSYMIELLIACRNVVLHAQ